MHIRLERENYCAHDSLPIPVTARIDSFCALESPGTVTIGRWSRRGARGGHRAEVSIALQTERERPALNSAAFKPGDNVREHDHLSRLREQLPPGAGELIPQDASEGFRARDSFRREPHVQLGAGRDFERL